MVAYEVGKKLVPSRRPYEMLAKKGLEQGSRRAEITELQRDGGNRVLRVSSNCLLISRSQVRILPGVLFLAQMLPE